MEHSDDLSSVLKRREGTEMDTVIACQALILHLLVNLFWKIIPVLNSPDCSRFNLNPTSGMTVMLRLASQKNLCIWQKSFRYSHMG